jgi:hypothetical protein
MVSFRRHWWLGGLLVFVALLAVAGPAQAQVPVAGYEVVWTGLLSMSQAPADDSQHLWLRGRGVNTVINLDQAMFDIGRYGFESFLWVALPSGRVPTTVEAERFLRFVQQPDNQPAHISSSLPAARAIMVALLRYGVDGWSLANALAEAQRVNLGAAPPLQMVEWLQAWAATNPPGSHRRSRT